MATLNTAVRYLARGRKANPNLKDMTQAFRNRDNASFLAMVGVALRRFSREQVRHAGLASGAVGCIGLTGEYGMVGYRLRRAQEVVRLDRTPSYWSHAFLIRDPLSTKPSLNKDGRRSPWILESSLSPAEGFSAFMECHGVSARRISDFNQARFHPLRAYSVPNIAIIAIALTDEERQQILDRADAPYTDQLNYDFSAMWGAWYAYITSKGEVANPILEGVGIPSAAYIQFAYDAAGVDLALGSRQRNITPEHIWQSARRLSHLFRTVGEGAQLTERPVVGWYCVRERACASYPPEEPNPIPQTISAQIKRIVAGSR
jgi:hypothetical protein